VRAVVSLAHGLGITVVAEGIETEEQARRLRDLGCDMGQGYAWAHPAPPVQLAAFLARRLVREPALLNVAAPGSEEPACEGLPALMTASGARRPRGGRGRPQVSGARSRRSGAGTGRG